MSIPKLYGPAPSWRELAAALPQMWHQEDQSFVADMLHRIISDWIDESQFISAEVIVPELIKINRTRAIASRLQKAISDAMAQLIKLGADYEHEMTPEEESKIEPEPWEYHRRPLKPAGELHLVLSVTLAG